MCAKHGVVCAKHGMCAEHGLCDEAYGCGSRAPKATACRGGLALQGGLRLQLEPAAMKAKGEKQRIDVTRRGSVILSSCVGKSRKEEILYLRFMPGGLSERILTEQPLCQGDSLATLYQNFCIYSLPCFDSLLNDNAQVELHATPRFDS